MMMPMVGVVFSGSGTRLFSFYSSGHFAVRDQRRESAYQQCSGAASCFASLGAGERHCGRFGIVRSFRYRQIMQSPQQTSQTQGMPQIGTRRALVLSGAGRYADPWHPFAATSVRISHILRDVGFAVEVSDAVDDSLGSLQSDASDIDLLVVNVGCPQEADASDAGSRAGLLAHVGRGGAVLSMHVSATSFPGIPEWEAVMGGIWVRGTTMHPDSGLAHIKVYPERHAIVAPLHNFTVFDERYSYLRTADDVVPLATHEHDGIEHPLVWAREYGSARVVYDALGHDARSYESAEHCELVGRAALWLVGELEEAR
jgi:uncharacterized protein